MKSLKRTLVLFHVAAALLLSQTVYAEDAAGEGSIAIDDVQGATDQAVGAGSENKTAEKVLQVYKAIGIDPQNAEEQLTNELNQIAIGGSVGTLQSSLEQLQAFSESKCSNFSQASSQCCNNPDSCKAAGLDLGKVSEGLGILGALLGGGGAAQCLGSMKPMIEGLTGAKGTSRMCKILREGGSVKFSGNEQRVQVLGCENLCETIAGRIDMVNEAAAGLVATDTTGLAASLVSSAGTLAGNVRKTGLQCGKTLAQGEGRAEAQGASFQQGIQGAMSCAQALVSGDETQVAEKAVDCSNTADAQRNPSICKGFGNANSTFDDLVNKTSGIDMAGDKGIGEPADEEAFGNKTENDGDNALGKTGQGKGSVGVLGGGGANSGAAQKAGGRARGKAKGKKLIAGYKAGRGGGGSSGRRPSSKRFRSKFKALKKAGKKDKAALAALSKLFAEKMGASPDQSEDIFARVSKRFSTSTTKEKMFDCKRNKKLWMER